MEKIIVPILIVAVIGLIFYWLLKSKENKTEKKESAQSGWKTLPFENMTEEELEQDSMEEAGQRPSNWGWWGWR